MKIQIEVPANTKLITMTYVFPSDTYPEMKVGVKVFDNDDIVKMVTASDFDALEKEEAEKLGMGKRITERLNELGMSQCELAKKVKITEVSLSRYINGDRTPKGPVISSIARALGVTSDWLLGM